MRDGRVRDPGALKQDGGLVRMGSQRRGRKHRQRGERGGGDRIGASRDRVEDEAARRLRYRDRERHQQRAHEQLEVGAVIDLACVVEQADQLGDEMLGHQLRAVTVAHARHNTSLG